MRAQKSWRTRWARYGKKKHAYEPGEFDDRFGDVSGDDKLKRERDLERELGGRDYGDVEYERFREQEETVGPKRRRRDEALNDEKALQGGLDIRRGWRRYLNEQAQEFAEEGQLQDIEFKRLLKQLPEQDRDEFIARVQQVEQIAAHRKRREREELVRGFKADDTDLEYLDDRISREATALMSSELRRMAELPKRHQGQRTFTDQQLKDRLEERVDRAFTTEGLAWDGKKKLITDAERDVLVTALGRSAVGRTDADRVIAQNAARKVSRQLAQRAQRRYDRDHAAWKAQEYARRLDYADFEFIERSVPHESGRTISNADIMEAELNRKMGAARQTHYQDFRGDERRLQKRAIAVSHDLSQTRADIINTQKQLERPDKGPQPFKKTKKLNQKLKRLKTREAGLARNHASTLGQLEHHRDVIKGWETRARQNRVVGYTPKGKFIQQRQLSPTAREFYNEFGHLPNHQIERGLLKRKIDAAKSGTLTVGYANGEHVNMSKAHYGIRPNKQWQYRVPDKDDPRIVRTRNLDYWDTKTDVGNIKSSSQEKLIEKFNHGVEVEPGKKAIRGYKIEKEPHIEKDIVVPMRGAGHTIQTVSSGTEKVTKFYVRDDSDVSRGGAKRWVESKVPMAQETQARMIKEGTGHRREFTKQTRLHFVDPSKLELDPTAYDRLNIKLPKTDERAFIDVHGYTPLRHVAAPFKARQQRREEEAAIDIYKKMRTRELMGALDREGDHVDRLAQARKQAYGELAKEEGLDAGRVRELAAIGAAATLYGTRRRVKEGYLPRAFNNSVKKLRGKNSRVDKLIKDYNIEKTPGIILDVEEAYVQPGIQTAANAKFMLRHPKTSIEGHGVGLKYGKFRNRSRFIRSSTREANRFQTDTTNVKMMDNTLNFLRQNADRKGVKGKFARWRGETIYLNESNYNKFDTGKPGSFVGEGVRSARAKLDEGTDPLLLRHELLQSARFAKSDDDKTAYKKALRKFESPSEQPKVRRRAAEYLQTARPHGVDPGELMKQRSAPIKFIKPPSRLNRWVEGDFTGPEKGVAVGAAAVGTALGAHYLYYRYKQHKLAPEQRESYTNFILPDRVTVFKPHVRRLSSYRIPDTELTRDFDIHNRRIPTRYGFRIEKDAINTNLASRGYPRGAPLTGRIKLRSPARGGSAVDSLFFDPNVVRSRRPKKGQEFDGYRPYIKGKKLPIRIQIGDREKIELTGTNPRNMTAESIDNLVWAYAGTRDEGRIRDMYRTNESLQNAFDNTRKIRQVRSARSKQEQKSMRDAERRYRKAGLTMPKRDRKPHRAGQVSAGTGTTGLLDTINIPRNKEVLKRTRSLRLSDQWS